MSELLQLRAVAAHAGPRRLFEGVDLVLHAGERLGLVGPNGAGKSTLLRLIAGEEAPEAGVRTVRRGLRLAWAGQEPALDDTATVEDFLRRRAMQPPGVAPGEDPEVAVRRWLGLGGFADPHALLGTLSGGWRRRVALCAELLLDPDLLLLDEPTNHLDLEGILWLERTLLSLRAAVVVVSHDRRFLENVATSMAEIDRRHPGGFFSCEGRYSTFLERRAEAWAQLRREETHLAARVREEIRYLRQGPKARRSRSQSRVERAHANIAELDRLRGLQVERSMQGAFSGTGRRSRQLIQARRLRIEGQGWAGIRDLDLHLGPGSRLGLVGPNGSGKSTLLRALAGERKIDGGELRRAPGLRVAWFDQERDQLDGEWTLAHALSPEGDSVEIRGQRMHVKTWARRLGFRDEQLGQAVRTLSGGERARVLLARWMRLPADLLLLDEPTNDLDIPTIEALEDSLLSFEGAVVLVTHDRFLMERVADSILALESDGRWGELADLEQWQQWRGKGVARPPGASEGRAARADPKEEAKPSPRARSRLSYHEKRELASMEETILAAEQELERLRARADAAELSALDRNEVYRQIQQSQEKIDALYERWSQLEARSSGGEASS